MDGAASIKKPLNGLLSKLNLAWWEAGLLVGLGAAAVVLHQALRLPLELPGRHGIEWMALLVLGRSLSRSKTAGTLTGLGAAFTSILPIWGALDDPFIWLIYLVPGLVMDFAFARLPRWTNSLIFLASLGALAHGTKPLARWLINLATGFPYGSLLWGVFYPLGLHMAFGAAGGLLGALVALGVRKLSDRNKS
jgi:hypothetical protein